MRNLKKILALVLALVMAMSLVTMANAADFSDSADINYKEAVDVMTAIGVIDGLDTGAFNPTGTLTREQAAKIIATMMLGSGADKLGTTSSSFKDVAATRWSSPYIEYCASIGIIAGNGDGTFNPTGKLTGHAFAKMLLGALGYNSEYEGYTGAGWSIEVAKDAVTAGISVDGVAMSAQLTREQAAQMAFQALKATMVEYKTAGTSIVTPDGFTVVTAGSTASKVENNATKAGYDGDKDGFQQFCEEYFSDLKLNSNSADAFGRPASKWTYKTKTVGTYADKAAASYTEDVKLGDIYSDLGLSERTDATVLKNGVEASAKAVLYRGNSSKLSAVDLTQGGSTKVATGNGTLTEAYVDDDNNVTLVVIDTYVGQVSRTVAETSSRDAYIVISTMADARPVNTNVEYETNAEYADDAYVLYTYADGEVQSVALAEMVSGTVTSYTAGKSLTMDGTSYKYAQQIAGTKAPSTKADYDVYLDQYGYAIYVDEQEFVSSDYAFVVAAENETDSNLSSANRAKLVFTDGTVKTVTTDKGYKGLEKQIVTYKVDENEYVLRAVSTTQNNTDATGAKDNETFKLTKGAAKITMTTTGGSGNSDTVTVYANSNTVFMVASKSGSDTVYNAYTGISNVPSITAGSGKGVSAYWYCKNGTMANIVYIDATNASSISSSSSDVTFLANKSVSGKITDSNNNVYYTYNAVVNGEITTVMVDATVDVSSVMTDGKLVGTKNAIFGNANYSNDNIITGLTAYETSTAKDVYAAEATGTAKLSGDSTIGFGTSNITYWTVAKDCKVFYVNTDGEISEYSTSSIGTDDNDVVNYIVDNGEVSYIFIQEVAAGATVPGTSDTYSVALAKNGTTSSTLDLTVKSTNSGDSTTKFSYKVFAYSITSGKDTAVQVNAGNGTLTSGTSTVSVITGTNNTLIYYVVVEIAGETLTTATVIGG